MKERKGIPLRRCLLRIIVTSPPPRVLISSESPETCGFLSFVEIRWSRQDKAYLAKLVVVFVANSIPAGL